jgi:hypothetical protein
MLEHDINEILYKEHLTLEKRNEIRQRIMQLKTTDNLMKVFLRILEVQDE